MKSVFSRRALIPLRLTRSDIWLTLLPALLWPALVWLRPMVIQPRCVNQPEFCASPQVPGVDRFALGLDSPEADQLSYATQNASGFIAIGGPLLWNLGTLAVGQATPAGTLISVGTDLVLFAQAATWNGVGTEMTHFLSQRARPFVYGNPRAAQDPSNYTSLYSGHTSFAAAACAILFLILLARGAPAFVLWLAFASGQVLVVSTAMYRVLAGRHFPTDTFVGAVAGTLIALLVAWTHRPER